MQSFFKDRNCKKNRIQVPDVKSGKAMFSMLLKFLSISTLYLSEYINKVKRPKIEPKLKRKLTLLGNYASCS